MISKVLLLASCLVYVNAGGLLSAPAISYGPALPAHAPLPVSGSYAVNTGHSSVQRSQDAFGNYMFGYNVNGHLGDTKSRYEKRDGYGNVMGWYTINDIDGRSRRVDYTADHLGFRANVATNEPGTLPSAAGAAAFNGGALKAPLVAAGPALAAPIAPIAAPLPAFSHGFSGYNFGGIAPHAMTYAPALSHGYALNRFSAPYSAGAY